MTMKGQLYSMAGEQVQAVYDRAKFVLGLRPRVNLQAPKINEQFGLYPSSYRACLIISADFELAWGWRYVKGVANPVDHAVHRAEQARQNFLKLLSLFNQYQIPLTWATVGHLFLEKCIRKNGQAHPKMARPGYFENEFWRFTSGDWFDDDPCTDWRGSSAWYAPDLISSILKAKVKVEHEIACHTFSHVDFSDRVCPPSVAHSELQKCQEIAKACGLKLTSFVFPANLPGNIDALKRHGFSCYRLDTGYDLDYPQRDDFGLWQIPGGVCMEKPSEEWSDVAWVNVLKRHVDLAIETGTVCHFWFHPCADSNNISKIIPALLKYVAKLQDHLWVTTMAGLTKWLESGGVRGGEKNGIR